MIAGNINRWTVVGPTMQDTDTHWHAARRSSRGATLDAWLTTGGGWLCAHAFRTSDGFDPGMWDESVAKIGEYLCGRSPGHSENYGAHAFDGNIPKQVKRCTRCLAQAAKRRS